MSDHDEPWMYPTRRYQHVGMALCHSKHLFKSMTKNGPQDIAIRENRTETLKYALVTATALASTSNKWFYAFEYLKHFQLSLFP